MKLGLGLSLSNLPKNPPLSGSAYPTISVKNYALWLASDSGGDNFYPAKALGSGVGNYFIKSGSPIQTTISGKTFLNTDAGCYYWDKTGATFPAGMAFDVWAEVQANPITKVFYNGPQINPGNSATNISLDLLNAKYNVGTKFATYNALTSGDIRSFHWSRPTGGLVSNVTAYQNGAALTQTSLGDRIMDASGAFFVVGGITNTLGGIICTPNFRLRSLVITFGENLSASDRANLESWRLSS